jgi:hypothetical protein
MAALKSEKKHQITIMNKGRNSEAITCMTRSNAIKKTKRYCARLSKKQKEICQLAHHDTLVKELYHDGSWHYGMEVCAECGRYIKFVPWPQHLWHVRDKIRSNWSKGHLHQLPLLPEPLCEHCGKNARQWGSTWCDACMWDFIKDDGN